MEQELRGLIPGFMAHKRDDLMMVLSAVPERDFASIKRIAHRMKGEGVSYGFNTIADIGRELEAAAASRDDGAAAALARHLLAYLDRVEVVFNESPG
ncbi:MAG TPA: Hpt domain-containing protein [Candidatus Binataceae bacterium]|nr:Hpt domain-containing protein [Candidatus Binataceae bacterium]